MDFSWLEDVDVQNQRLHHLLADVDLAVGKLANEKHSRNFNDV